MINVTSPAPETVPVVSERRIELENLETRLMGRRAHNYRMHKQIWEGWRLVEDRPDALEDLREYGTRMARLGRVLDRVRGRLG